MRIFAAVGLLLVSVQVAVAKEPYRNAALEIEERVVDLIRRMTLDEKIAQLCCLQEEKAKLCDATGRLIPAAAHRIMPHGIGQVARPSHPVYKGFQPGVDPLRGPKETAEFVNELQRYAVERTRLGIPILFHGEGLHGYHADEATSFPTPIALASTWNPKLIEEVYAVVAREMRARGVSLALTPVLDVARDPRWGRIEETPGEDPYLVSRFGVAAVRGFQGGSLPLSADRVFATLKHFAAHGQPVGGSNIGPGLFSERMVREVFLPPFESAIREANAQCVMVTYNEVDGIPCVANEWLLRTVLRDEWGFDGVTVSDYWAIPELADLHGVATDHPDAVATAINAGVDVELPDRRSFQHVREVVDTGRVSHERIDEAVANVLRNKFRAGLFEQPYANPELADRATGDAAAREVALRAARQAITLLKNDGDVLPLDASSIKRLAVIGPNAADVILGGYSGTPRQSISILEGIRRRAPDGMEVVHAEGCRITEGRNWWSDEVKLADADENRRLIEEAVAIAKESDFVVLAVGGNEHTAREAWSKTHLGDRDSLQLVGQQNELALALHELGKPMAVLLVNGRPLATNFIADNVPALAECWCLGQETGTAVAEVLFGDVNPSGKLPVSIPRSVGQLPVYYNRKPTARRGYLFAESDPLFPFGYGLSYTRFEISEPRLQASVARCGETVHVSVDVRNVGSRAGAEVVQVYLRDRVASITRPVKALCAFQRVTLQPGERKTASFALPPSAFALYDRAMRHVIEPGVFTIMAGPNSVALKSVEIELTGEPYALDDD